MTLDPPFGSGPMIGKVLLGRYRIVRELAKGGMGVVYLARAEGAVGFVKPVVIKLVLPEHATDERFRNMFVREAQILANLRHPGIVDVIELNEEAGAYVMVLEYVRGYHLGQWSKYLRLKERTLPAGVAIQIVIDVLEALHHAHAMAHPDGTSMHIVHRDVSPSNILLDEDGRARLLDFGVARMRGGNAEYMTQVKGFVGKLIYSAPEVFAEGGDATPKSDAYACAVVLHELLAGKNPFRMDSQAQTLHRVLHHVPEALEAICNGAPAGLDAVLAKALAKAPEDRYETALDFAHALRALQAESESELRKRLAAMLRGDFGREMSELLGLESLADRDDAWRRLSTQPPESDATSQADRELSFTSMADPSYASTHSGSGSGSGSDSGRVQGRALDSVPPEDPSTASQQRLSPAPAPQGTPSTPVTAAPRRAPHNRGKSGAGEPLPAAPRSREAHVPTVRVEAPRPGFTLSQLVVPALALGLGVLGSFAYLARRDAAVAAAPAVSVISESPPARVSSAEDAGAAPPAAHEDDAGAPAPAARKSRRERRTAARTPSPAGGAPNGADPQMLSAALAGQRTRIEACFNAASVSVQGVATVSLMFDVDAKGHVKRAEVAPPAVASTELGRCLRHVGLGTSFPASGQPLSFSIPVSAKAGRAR